MRLFLFNCIFLFGFSASFAQGINKIKIDEKSQKEVLFGQCDQKGIAESVLFKEHYSAEYSQYHPVDSILKKISKNQNYKHLKIIVVFGSWCGDSQEQVPRFLKILDELKFDKRKLSLYAVDRTKKLNIPAIDALNVQLVPTFVFYYKNNEIGRIIETPQTSLENDLLIILEKFNKSNLKKKK